MCEHGAPQNVLNNFKKEQSNESEEAHPVRRSLRVHDKTAWTSSSSSSTTTTTTTTTAMITMGRTRIFCLPLYSMKALQDNIWTGRIFVLFGRIIILIVFLLKNHWSSKHTSQS